MLALAQVRPSRLILMASLLQVMLSFGIIFPLMPHYMEQMGASSFHLGLFLTVGAMAQVLFAPTWGNLSDRIGRRPVLICGLLGHSASLLALAFAPSIWILLLSQAIGGIFSSAVFPTAQAYVADTTTKEERAGAMGGMGAIMNLGFVGGPVLGGLLVTFGPRIPFLVAALFALCNGLFSYFFLPEPSVVRTSARVVGGGNSVLKLAAQALRSPERVYFLLTFVGTFGGSALFTMLGFYLMDRLGAADSMLAVAYTFNALIMVLFQGLLTGYAARWFGEERTIRICLMMGILGFGLLIFASQYWHVALSLVLVTGSVGLLRPLVTALISLRSTLDQGVVMGIQSSFDAFGRAIAPPLAGALFLIHSAVPFMVTIAVSGLFLFWITVGKGSGLTMSPEQTANRVG